MLHVKEIYESSERWREDERLVRTPAPINRTVFSLSPPPPILICFGFDSYTVVLEPKKKKMATWKFQKVQTQKSHNKSLLSVDKELGKANLTKQKTITAT